MTSKQNSSRPEQNREKKRAEFSAPARKGGVKPVQVIVLVLFAGLAVYLLAGGLRDKTAAPVGGTSVKAGAGDIRVPLSDVAGGEAKFFDYTLETGRPARFFVVKSSDGVYRAAMDTCDVCYRARKGYRQEGDEMVCNNCGQRFPSNRINEVSGGCNPVGLPRTVEGDHLVIKASEVEKRGQYF